MNTPGTEILLEAHRLVNQDRQSNYGHPLDDYKSVVEIFYALTGIELNPRDALLFMVSVKMARLRTNFDGGTLHYDSLVDAIGYLTCINMIHEVDK